MTNWPKAGWGCLDEGERASEGKPGPTSAALKARLDYGTLKCLIAVLT